MYMTKKEHTLEDFSRKRLNTSVLEESASVRPGEPINCSSILTKLIQEAGRWCRSYASDLFISWRCIIEKMEQGTLTSGVELFGFRENGVDHTSFILSRYNNSSIYTGHEYRAIWRLDINVEDIGEGMIEIKFELYEVDR